MAHPLRGLGIFNKFTPSFTPSSESIAIALHHNQNACLASIDGVIMALHPTQSFLIINGLLRTLNQRATGSIPVRPTNTINGLCRSRQHPIRGKTCFRSVSGNWATAFPCLSSAGLDFLTIRVYSDQVDSRCLASARADASPQITRTLDAYSGVTKRLK